MYNWWRKYGIFIKERRHENRKWRKLERQVNKFQKLQKKRESEIQEISVENQMKKDLINDLNRELKKKLKVKAKTRWQVLKRRQRKIMKTMKNKLKSAKGEHQNVTKKLKSLKTSPKNKISKTKAHPKSVKVQQWRHKAWRKEFIKELQTLYKPGAEMTMQNIIDKIEKDEQELDGINDKIIKAINDIREIEKIISYIKNSTCNHFKLKPLIKTIYWMKPPEKSAKVVMNKIKYKKSTKQIRQEVLDFQRQYILEHIPELMPDMYSYLKN